MNYRGGIALIQRTWASWLQERGFFLGAGFRVDDSTFDLPVRLVHGSR